MSKKLKGIIAASALLVFSAISVTALSACSCEPETDEPTPEPNEELKISAISITNKAALQAEYSETEGPRTLELAITSNGSTNAQELMMSGDLTVNSSDTKVATVTGLQITPVSAGKTTITVANKDNTVKDSVEITIKELDTSLAVSLRTIKDSEEDKVFITKAQVVGQCAGGFFIADQDAEGKAEYMYVYYEMPGNVEVGKTYYFQAKRGEYSGIAQLTSDSFFAKAVPAGEEFNITPDFSKVPTSENLNKFKDSEFAGDIIPATMTLTVYDDFDNSGEAFLWIDKGFASNTCVYTGYMSPNLIPEGIKINDRYKMTGFFSGTSNRDGFANRINFYAMSLEKQDSFTVTKLTASSQKSELQQGESSTLSTAVEEDGAAADVYYVVTAGKEFVDENSFISKDSSELASATIKSKRIGEGTTGTIKLKAIDRNTKIESTEITINVTGEIYLPTSIASLYDLEDDAFKGKLHYVYGVYAEYINDYGIVIEDGEKSLLIYGADAPKGVSLGSYVTVEGEGDIYNGLVQLKNATVAKANEEDLAVKPTAGVKVDLTNPANATAENAMRLTTISGVIESYNWSPRKEIDGYDLLQFKVTEETRKYSYNVRLDSRYVAEDVMTQLAPTEEVKSLDGYRITFDARLAWFNAPQLGYARNIKKLEKGEPLPPVEAEGKIRNLSEVYTVEVDYQNPFEGLKTYGILTYKVVNVDGELESVIIEDGDKALLVETTALPTDVNVNDKVYVEGTLEEDFGELLVTGATIKKVGGDVTIPAEPKTPEAVDFTKADMDDMYRVSTIEGIVTVPGAQMTVTVGEKDFTVYANSHLTKPEDLDKLKNAKPGDTIKVVGRIDSFKENVQLGYINSVEIVKEAPVTPEVEYDVIDSIDFRGYKQNNTYAGNKTFEYGDGAILMSNGGVSTGDDWKGLVMGTNKATNFTGNVDLDILKLFDTSATADANVIEYNDKSVNVTSTIFDFTTDPTDVFEVIINEGTGNINDDGGFVAGFIIESIDGGATWSIGKEFESYPTTITYTKDSKESTKYGVVVLSTGSKFRYAINEVSYGVKKTA